MVAGREHLRSAALRMPIGFGTSTDEVLQRAYRSYGDEYGAIRELTAEKVEFGRHYDVSGMNRAVTICHCGGSGSLLAASYLDNHPDIVILPMLTSTYIYPFFQKYSSLSVWEKLVAYPLFSGLKTNPDGGLERNSDGDFFQKDNPTGDFAIDPADYYASVHALYELYGDRPAAWLDARPRFFQFLYVAFAIAVGRRLENPRPLMVYAQHWFDQELAERFIEDFPDGQFIHTIRDPISGLDSWFDRKLDMEMYGEKYRPEMAVHYFDPAVATNLDLVAREWDRSHRGMESRSRAIRFEDMHLALEPTMRRLAAWLDIPYRPSMLESTWNGTPYVVQIRGVAWCGPNPANARRRWKNLGLTDRLVLFALLHNNFIAWDYPSPKALNRLWIRLCIIAIFWILPMKMELKNARVVQQLQALPNLRRGRFGFAFGAPFFLLKRRLRMMVLIAAAGRSRLVGDRPPMKLV